MPLRPAKHRLPGFVNIYSYAGRKAPAELARRRRITRFTITIIEEFLTIEMAIAGCADPANYLPL